jgi:hypothetical protein
MSRSLKKLKSPKHPPGTLKRLKLKSLDKLDDESAWELVFGLSGRDPPLSFTMKRWSLFGTSSSNLNHDSNNHNDDNDEDDDNKNNDEEQTGDQPKSPQRRRRRRRRPIVVVDMAPSKREGIRHAFTAEALRCIGSSEVKRLQQLADSGMPANIELDG